MTGKVKTAEEIEAENQSREQDANLDENDTQKNEDNQTDEDGQAEEGEDGNIVKQEESPYKAELDKLNEDLAKKQDIIEKKNRALEAEKQRRKEAEKALDDKDEEIDGDETLSDDEKKSLKEDLRAEVKAEFQAERFNGMLENYTSGKIEAELIKKIYDNKVVKSGNLKEDFEMAVAIANKNIVLDYKRGELTRQNEENDVIKSMSSDVRSNVKSKNQSPVNKIAAQILRNAGMAEAIKKLK